MVAESQLGGGIEGEVVVIGLLIEVLFELVVIEFFFLVPVAEFGLGGEPVGHVVVVHLRSYIFIINPHITASVT